MYHSCLKLHTDDIHKLSALDYRDVVGIREEHDKMQKLEAARSLIKRLCEILFWREIQVELDGYLKKISDLSQLAIVNLKESLQHGKRI